MCMMVYIASDYTLPTSTWDKARPCLYVEALCERDEWGPPAVHEALHLLRRVARGLRVQLK